MVKTKVTERLGWVAARGSLLGVCHLTVYKAVLDFLEQPLDPFGTKATNVDLQMRQFVMKKTQAKEAEELGTQVGE